MSSSERAVVRRATVADASVVGVLLYDFNTEFETPTPSAKEFAARFERLLARDDVLVLLAEVTDLPPEGSHAVGFAYLTLRPTPYGDGPLAQLEELYIRPRSRGQGIGTALLTAALAGVTERGAIEMHIDVDEIDLGARRFYERHGFVNIEPGTDHRMLFYLREIR
jgi:GNAT superfamily N-acetyltransferase